MNRNELAHQLAQSEGIPDTVAIRMVNRVFEIIGDSVVAGDTVVIRNFGRFETRVRQPIERVNPKTGDRMLVPERRTAAFRASPAMKARVNEKEGRESST